MSPPALTTCVNSGVTRVVRPGHPGERRLQPRRHRLGACIHRTRMDHDPWRRLLLFRPTSSQKRIVDDMALDDGSRSRILPGMSLMRIQPI